MPRTKDVTLKNTKQDILSAYEELLQSVRQETAPAQLQSQVKTKSLATATYAESLKRLATELSTALNTSIDQIIARLEDGTKTIALLTETQKTVQENASIQAEKVTKIRNQEEEEYQYEYAKRKARQEQELKEAKENTEKALKARELEVQSQESELAELKNLRDNFESTVEKRIAEAVKKAITEAEKEHTHQRELAQRDATATQKLLEQQIANLQSQIESQTLELKRLQKETTIANEYVTRIAERAVAKPTQMANQGQISAKDES